MRYVTAKECAVISLGRRGENLAETVQFDVTGWEETYGTGAYSLLHMRAGDTAPYECPISVEDETVNWPVRDSDTAVVGRGEAQLLYIVGGAVAKSVVFVTSVLKALDGDPDFPDPYDQWLAEMHEDAEYVREHYEDALGAKEDAEAWAVGQRSGVDVPETDETFENNSKWYASLASDNGEAWAVGQRGGVDVGEDDPAYHNNAKYYAEKAAEDGEAWATGKRGGTDVGTGDETYHNNAKYYSEQSNGYSVASQNSAEAAARSATQAAGYVGSPLVASTRAGMTDRTKVYVYTGSESGMSNGHWYYWNGTAWTDGGVYNSIADDVATEADLRSALYS